jgi:hypothetical protein
LSTIRSCRATGIAHELGIPSLFVETNCYWCRDDAGTRDRLAELKAAGLNGIMVSVGDWFELDELTRDGVSAADHPLMGFLIAEDVEALLRFAQDMDYSELPGGFLSKCDLCLDVRKYLVTQDDFAELQPRSFYEHLD